MLRLASGLSPAAVRTFVEHRDGGLAWITWQRLANICSFMNWGQLMKAPAKRNNTHAQLRRIALLVEFEIPSKTYHWSVLKSISEFTAERNIDLSICPVVPGGLARAVASAVKNHDPDAFILVRLSPDEETMKALQDIPTILVHADRREYDAPVIGNLVCDHKHVAEDLRNYLAHVLCTHRA